MVETVWEAIEELKKRSNDGLVIVYFTDESTVSIRVDDVVLAVGNTFEDAVTLAYQRKINVVDNK